MTMKVVPQRITKVAQTLREKKRIFFNEAVIHSRISALAHVLRELTRVPGLPYLDIMFSAATDAAAKDLTESIENYVAQAGQSLFPPTEVAPVDPSDPLTPTSGMSKILPVGGPMVGDVRSEAYEKSLAEMILKMPVAEFIQKHPVAYRTDGVTPPPGSTTGIISDPYFTWKPIITGDGKSHDAVEIDLDLENGAIKRTEDMTPQEVMDMIASASKTEKKPKSSKKSSNKSKKGSAKLKVEFSPRKLAKKVKPVGKRIFSKTVTDENSLAALRTLDVEGIKKTMEKKNDQRKERRSRTTSKKRKSRLSR